MPYRQITSQFSMQVRLKGSDASILRELEVSWEVMWHEWTPGVESVQDLVLQNVALVTQKAWHLELGRPCWSGEVQVAAHERVRYALPGALQACVWS